MRYWLWGMLLVISAAAGSAQGKTVVDILNRKVVVPDAPTRIVLGESRLLYTLALVRDGDPVKDIVGWPADMQRYDNQSWQLYLKAFPQISQISQLNAASYDQLNAEKIISLKPDLVILPLYAKDRNDPSLLRGQLEKSGIPVIYVDLRVDQLNNTLPSLRLLGQVLNSQAKTQRFIDFYQQHMQAVRQRLATYHGPKPTVILQLHLGRKESCCTTVSHSNLADLLDYAGGDNIASGKFGSVYGEMNPEAVIAANPDVYITTGMGGSDGKDKKSLRLGPGVTAQQAQDSFRRIMSNQPILSSLRAVKEGRAYGVWHNFYLSPYHLVDVEVFAKALYPQLFADLDPQQTVREIYQQFLPIPFNGTYWDQLKPQ